MKSVIWRTLAAGLLALLAGCADDSGYDGCHGVGCLVDDPDAGDQTIDDRPQYDSEGERRQLRLVAVPKPAGVGTPVRAGQVRLRSAAAEPSAA